MWKWFVYVDYTNDGRPFYVGKGNKNRVKDLKRNIVHQRIVEKYGCNRQIIAVFNDECAAFDFEIVLVEEYKTRAHIENNWGANLTKGGEGPSGCLRSPEVRLKLSKKAREAHARPEVKSKHRAATKEARSRPEVKKFWKQKQNDPEYEAKRRQAISKAKKGKPQSELARKINSECRVGIPLSELHREAIGRGSLAKNRLCKICNKFGHYKHHCPDRKTPI